MSLVERLRGFSAYPEAARSHEGLTDRFRNSLGVAHDTMLEAADTIEQLVEALTYTRAALGDPVPIGKRHIARKIDAALSKASETQP
jgi:hypothetical protein